VTCTTRHTLTSQRIESPPHTCFRVHLVFEP
jgi:hypothetical protein